MKAIQIKTNADCFLWTSNLKYLIHYENLVQAPVRETWRWSTNYPEEDWRLSVSQAQQVNTWPCFGIIRTYGRSLADFEGWPESESWVSDIKGPGLCSWNPMGVRAMHHQLLQHQQPLNIHAKIIVSVSSNFLVACSQNGTHCFLKQTLPKSTVCVSLQCTSTHLV